MLNSCQKRRQETAHAIQTATLELAIENGLENITTEEIAAAIGENASEQVLKRLAVPEGATLFAQGLKLVADGRSTLPEVRRVLGDL